MLRDVLNHALDVAEEVSRRAERDSLDLIDDRLADAKILVVNEVLASGRDLKNETHVGGDRQKALILKSDQILGQLGVGDGDDARLDIRLQADARVESVEEAEERREHNSEDAL